MNPFDLVIIGGGMIGCGIARDAALRGLSVALFEKDDFGSGTTSRSTRLIHGGLRYLEQLDFGLVRQDLREREILLRIAPHRVRPLPFLIPFYRRSLTYRLRLRTGMALYDLLSYDKSLSKHRWLDRAETLRLEPSLTPEGLQGAALYFDAQVAFAERLCLDNALDAAAHGAHLYNHTVVTGLLRGAAGRVEGVTARDALTGAEIEARAGIVINAAGPWLDSLTETLTRRDSRRIRLAKGIHFAAPPLTHNALVLTARDGRLFFVIPWMGYAWVGTTDTDFQDDLDAARATGEDVRYLLDSAAPALPPIAPDAIHYTNAGVRALVRSDDPGAEPSAVSRKHRLLVHTPEEGLDGLISVLGGKITAYRDIAREAVDACCRLRLRPACEEAARRGVKLRVTIPECLTAGQPLPGGEVADSHALRAAIGQSAAKSGLDIDSEQTEHLIFLYGAAYRPLLERIEAAPELGQRLAPDYLDMRAEVHHAVRHEFARTACDYLMRRSGLFFTPDQGRKALLPVAREMAALLDWDDARQQAEIAAYEHQIALTQAFRSEM